MKEAFDVRSQLDPVAESASDSEDGHLKWLLDGVNG